MNLSKEPDRPEYNSGRHRPTHRGWFRRTHLPRRRRRGNRWDDFWDAVCLFLDIGLDGLLLPLRLIWYILRGIFWLLQEGGEAFLKGLGGLFRFLGDL